MRIMHVQQTQYSTAPPFPSYTATELAAQRGRAIDVLAQLYVLPRRSRYNCISTMTYRGTNCRSAHSNQAICYVLGMGGQIKLVPSRHYPIHAQTLPDCDVCCRDVYVPANSSLPPCFLRISQRASARHSSRSTLPHIEPARSRADRIQPITPRAPSSTQQPVAQALYPAASEICVVASPPLSCLTAFGNVFPTFVL
jgi:hypothetical protein